MNFVTNFSPSEKHVITEYINKRFKLQNNRIKDLDRDLLDHTKLTKLLEIITGRRFPTVIGNVANVYEIEAYWKQVFIFLKSQCIDVNYSDIDKLHSGSIDAILSIVWNCLMHTSIYSALENEFQDIPKEYVELVFLNWLNSKLNVVSPCLINDFSKSWRDGVLLGNLVHLCDNEMCTDYATWRHDNYEKNTTFAMEAAAQCLGIIPLFSPIDLANGKVSGKSMIIYLSQFISVILNPTDSYLPQALDGTMDDADTSLVMAGLSPDVIQNEYAVSSNDINNINNPEFISHELNSMYKCSIKLFDTRLCNLIDKECFFVVYFPKSVVANGKLKVQAINEAENLRVLCELHCDMNKEYSYKFIPTKCGIYHIQVIDTKCIDYSNRIINEPFKFFISDVEEEIMVYGPGLHSALTGKKGSFVLETNGLDCEIGFSMEGPSKTQIECTDIGDGCVKISYIAHVPGLYRFTILSNGQKVCQSPYAINVMLNPRLTNSSLLDNVKIYGISNENMFNFFIMLPTKIKTNKALFSSSNATINTPMTETSTSCINETQIVPKVSCYYRDGSIIETMIIPQQTIKNSNLDTKEMEDNKASKVKKTQQTNSPDVLLYEVKIMYEKLGRCIIFVGCGDYNKKVEGTFDNVTDDNGILQFEGFPIINYISEMPYFMDVLQKSVEEISHSLLNELEISIQNVCMSYWGLSNKPLNNQKKELVTYRDLKSGLVLQSSILVKEKGFTRNRTAYFKSEIDREKEQTILINVNDIKKCKENKLEEQGDNKNFLPISNDETDVGLAIEGPSDTYMSVELDKHKEGLCICRFKLLVAGNYKITITLDGQMIRDCPFILEATEPIKVFSSTNSPQDINDQNSMESNINQMISAYKDPSGTSDQYPIGTEHHIILTSCSIEENECKVENLEDDVNASLMSFDTGNLMGPSAYDMKCIIEQDDNLLYSNGSYDAEQVLIDNAEMKEKDQSPCVETEHIDFDNQSFDISRKSDSLSLSMLNTSELLIDIPFSRNDDNSNRSNSRSSCLSNYSSRNIISTFSKSSENSEFSDSCSNSIASGVYVARLRKNPLDELSQEKISTNEHYKTNELNEFNEKEKNHNVLKPKSKKKTEKVNDPPPLYVSSTSAGGITIDRVISTFTAIAITELIHFSVEASISQIGGVHSGYANSSNTCNVNAFNCSTADSCQMKQCELGIEDFSEEHVLALSNASTITTVNTLLVSSNNSFVNSWDPNDSYSNQSHGFQGNFAENITSTTTPIEDPPLIQLSKYYSPTQLSGQYEDECIDMLKEFTVEIDSCKGKQSIHNTCPNNQDLIVQYDHNLICWDLGTQADLKNASDAEITSQSQLTINNVSQLHLNDEAFVCNEVIVSDQKRPIQIDNCVHNDYENSLGGKSLHVEVLLPSLKQKIDSPSVFKSACKDQTNKHPTKSPQRISKYREPLISVYEKSHAFVYGEWDNQDYDETSEDEKSSSILPTKSISEIVPSLKSIHISNYTTTDNTTSCSSLHQYTSAATALSTSENDHNRKSVSAEPIYKEGYDACNEEYTNLPDNDMFINQCEMCMITIYNQPNSNLYTRNDVALTKLSVNTASNLVTQSLIKSAKTLRSTNKTCQTMIWQQTDIDWIILDIIDSIVRIKVPSLVVDIFMKIIHKRRNLRRIREAYKEKSIDNNPTNVTEISTLIYPENEIKTLRSCPNSYNTSQIGQSDTLSKTENHKRHKSWQAEGTDTCSAMLSTPFCSSYVNENSVKVNNDNKRLKRENITQRDYSSYWNNNDNNIIPFGTKKNEKNHSECICQSFSDSVKQSSSQHHQLSTPSTTAQTQIESLQLLKQNINANITTTTTITNSTSHSLTTVIETLVNRITEIAKTRLIQRPTKQNIKRVEILLKLLPKLLEYGRQRKLKLINALADQLEMEFCPNPKKSNPVPNHSINTNGKPKKPVNKNNEEDNDYLERLVQCLKKFMTIDDNDQHHHDHTHAHTKLRIKESSNSYKRVQQFNQYKKEEYKKLLKMIETKKNDKVDYFGKNKKTAVKNDNKNSGNSHSKENFDRARSRNSGCISKLKHRKNKMLRKHLRDKFNNKLLKMRDQLLVKLPETFKKRPDKTISNATHNQTVTTTVTTHTLSCNEVPETYNRAYALNNKKCTDRIYVIGTSLNEGLTNQENKFVVHSKLKQSGDLTITFEGPSEATINFLDKKIGLYVVTYQVSLQGVYKCSIKIGGIHIPKSPYIINIWDSPQSLKKRDKQSKLCESSLSLKKHNHTSSKSSKISSIEFSHCKTKRIPNNIDKDIPSSPIPIYKQPDQESEIFGMKYPTIYTLPKGRKVYFHITFVRSKYVDLSKLSCFVTGPSGDCGYMPIECSKPPVSQFGCQEGVVKLFTGETGVYTMDFYNSNGIKVCDSQTLNVSNNLTQSLICNMASPNSSVIHCSLALSNVPIVSQSHESSNDTIVTDFHSESSLIIAPEKPQNHHSILTAYGRGIQHGYVDMPNIFFVLNQSGSNSNTVSISGNEFSERECPSELNLSVTIDGPSKVEVQCEEEPKPINIHENDFVWGTNDLPSESQLLNSTCYRFTYVPLVAGQYLITIKLTEGFHIPGSPFKVNIVSRSDSDQMEM